MAHLLHVAHYWVMDKLPNSIIEYCSSTSPNVWAIVAQAELGEDALFDQLREILKSTRSGTFYTNETQLSCSPLTRAIISERSEIVDQLVKFGGCHYTDPMYVTEFAAAAFVGRADFCKKLLDSNYAWSGIVCNIAAYAGSLDCLRFLHENDCPWDNNVCVYAARGGNLDCLKYAGVEGLDFRCEAIAEAAANGDINCLRYLRESGCDWHTDTLQYLIEGTGYPGFCDCLEYVLHNGCPISVAACTAACWGGEITIIQLLKDYGAVFNRVEYTAAAARHKLTDILEYLFNLGCPWDALTTHQAAVSGSINCMRFALARGCPCARDVMEAAAGSNLVLLQFLHSTEVWMRDDVDFSSSRVVAAAFCSARFSALEYLAEQGYPFETCRLYEIDLLPLFERDSPFLADMGLAWCVEVAGREGWIPNIEFLLFVDEHKGWFAGTWQQIIMLLIDNDGIAPDLAFALHGVPDLAFALYGNVM